jgi:hypothetical protein
MRKIISINIYTHPAFDAIVATDYNFIGTPDYMGVAFYWNLEYKHYLRDASFVQRRRVHHMFIKAGLELDGMSDAHHAIIFKALKIS